MSSYTFCASWVRVDELVRFALPRPLHVRRRVCVSAVHPEVVSVGVTQEMYLTAGGEEQLFPYGA